MNFTKEELKEIEKIFDIAAGNHTYRIAEIITKLYNKAPKLINRIVKESVETFDTYRTISAKANKMQKEKDFPNPKIIGRK